jgi:hypothetical protein
MPCPDVLRLLDECEPGEPVPEAFLAHARECPSCAFALRLHRTLQTAPQWAPLPGMGAAARGRVMAKARRIAGRSGAGPLAWLLESALGASMVAVAVGAAGTLLPSTLHELLPPPAWKTLVDLLAPLTAFWAGLSEAFGPLAANPAGLTLMAATGFLVLMAAFASLRLLAVKEPFAGGR